MSDYDSRSETMKAYERELRQKMKDMLVQVTPEQFEVFRLMYDIKNARQHPVDNIPMGKMDWAFKQIETTIKENAARAAK